MNLAEYPTHPVTADDLADIERVAPTVLELRDALTSLAAPFRFLSLAVVTDELVEVYRMVQQAEVEFRANGIRDLSANMLRGAV